MKTCPNTKCKTTGIPDDANFCPACGHPMLSTNQNKKQIISKQDQLQQKVIKKQNTHNEPPLLIIIIMITLILCFIMYICLLCNNGIAFLVSIFVLSIGLGLFFSYYYDG